MNVPPSSLPFLEELYEQYLADPGSLPPEWQRWFGDMAGGAADDGFRRGPSFSRRSLFSPSDPGAEPPAPAAALILPGTRSAATHGKDKDFFRWAQTLDTR